MESEVTLRHLGAGGEDGQPTSTSTTALIKEDVMIELDGGRENTIRRCDSISLFAQRIRDVAYPDIELVKQCHAICEQQRRAAVDVMDACCAAKGPVFRRVPSTEVPSSNSCESSDDDDDQVDDGKCLLPNPNGVDSSFTIPALTQWASYSANRVHYK